MASDASPVTGVALTVDFTFGRAARSDLGPTPAPPFDIEHIIDALVALGVGTARLTIDWTRVQPHPSRIDTEWVERYDHVLDQLHAADVDVWCTALDTAVPQWFDNDGGLTDEAALTRWWPRWFEVVAERWGDHIAAWIPFDVVPDDGAQAWRDTIGILRGSDAPVAHTIDSARHDPRSLDLLAESHRPDADVFAISGTWNTMGREHELLQAIADETDAPVAIARAGLGAPLADTARAVRETVDELADDVPTAFMAWFVDPLRADGTEPHPDVVDTALLDGNGQPTEAAHIVFASS
ncbi:MAG: family 1 glycosylhydrolase [Actinomycetota bacterium]